MLLGAPTLAINRFLYASLGYDSLTDLVPVSLLCRFPNILAVSMSSPVMSVRGFIDHAKANPGKVTYSSPGIGTTPHLSGELFKRMAGIELTHVPYRGAAAGAVTDAIAGRVDSIFNTTGSLLQTVRTGQLRGLAVTTAQRFPTAPELPTIAESGVPGFDVSSWYALFMPRQDPARHRRQGQRRDGRGAVRARGRAQVRAARRRRRELNARGTRRAVEV